MPRTHYDDVLAAYEGAETLERFSAAELRAYRDELASRTERQASFVADRLPADARVLETFVHRSSGEIDDGRCEHLRLYDADELVAELRTAGFEDITRYGGWSGEPSSHDDALLVVCARRPGRAPR